MYKWYSTTFLFLYCFTRHYWCEVDEPRLSLLLSNISISRKREGRELSVPMLCFKFIKYKIEFRTYVYYNIVKSWIWYETYLKYDTPLFLLGFLVSFAQFFTVQLGIASRSACDKDVIRLNQKVRSLVAWSNSSLRHFYSATVSL